MQHTGFVVLEMAGRQVALNLAQVSKVQTNLATDVVSVVVVGDHDLHGTVAEMCPLLAAVGMLPKAPAPTDGDDPFAPSDEESDEELAAQAPSAEAELSPAEVGELRALLAEMHAVAEEDERAFAMALEMLAERAEEERLRASLSNEALLDLDWKFGSVQPGKAPIPVLLARAQEAGYPVPDCKRPGADVKSWKFELSEEEEEEAMVRLRRELEFDLEFGTTAAPLLRLMMALPPTRLAYCEQAGADKATWHAENGLLWKALRAQGLSSEARLRHAGASAVLGFEVTSYRHLRPAQLRRVRLAVEAGRFYSNWSLVALPSLIETISRAA